MSKAKRLRWYAVAGAVYDHVRANVGGFNVRVYADGSWGVYESGRSFLYHANGHEKTVARAKLAAINAAKRLEDGQP